MPFSQTKSPLLETLNFLDLTRLTNDPINNHVGWWVILTKLPYDILTFDGKSREGYLVHVMTFYLWFSLNSLNDDSIHLRLFQCTLSGTMTKWYVEFPCATFNDFFTLAMVLHFQFPICYETRTVLLMTLW